MRAVSSDSIEFVGLLVFAEDFCVFIELIIVVHAHISVLSDELMEVVLVEGRNSGDPVSVAELRDELVYEFLRVEFLELRHTDAEEVIYK